MCAARGTAVVTGAGSGIGLAAAAALADDGWGVVGTARNLAGAHALRELAARRPTVLTRELEVTSPSSVARCIGSVLDEYGDVDLLVNNAGAGHRGTLEQLDVDEFERCFDVNFFGVVRLTRAVLPGMRERGRGRIITVSSMNGVVALPFSDAYNAAKFAVEGLMEGLAPVLQTFGIAVSVLEPGPVRTAFLRNAGGRTHQIVADDPYAALLAAYDTTMAGLLDAGESVTDVAELIARIARADRPHFRYQSSANATAVAARKVVDPTGDAIVAATSACMLRGLDRSAVER